MKNSLFKIILISLLLVIGLLIVYVYKVNKSQDTLLNDTLVNVNNTPLQDTDKGEAPPQQLHPLSINYLKQGEYPGSELVFEQTLQPGSNYSRYIVSYYSEGLKQFALLTIPNGQVPENGWPVIIFNHGYIRPSEYVTTERYVAYTDAFSRNGYILLRPDYRGHGNSEGQARGGYSNNDYTIDVINAVESIRKYKDANPDKIGMWGHSMGGPITLENMVVRNDVKAGVIWAGVVGSYQDLYYNWRRRNFNYNQPDLNTNEVPVSTRGGGWRQELSTMYGDPEQNPQFWDSLSATSYLSDISGPVQLHHGTNDTSVPYEFSQSLNDRLLEQEKEVELYLYEGDDHNISANLSLALNRSVEFFDTYLK